MKRFLRVLLLALCLVSCAKENKLINPLETPAKDPLADRTPFFDRKDKIDPAFFEAGLEYYKKIAGYKAYDFEMNHVIKKWTSPLRIGVDDRRSKKDVKQGFFDAMQAFVKQLNSLGALPEISIYNKGEGPANVRLLVNTKSYLENTEFEKMERKSAMYVSWAGDPAYRLYAALVGVCFDKAEEEELPALAGQSLLQLLGFMSLTSDYEGSLFNSELSAMSSEEPDEHVAKASSDESFIFTLSELDWLLLEMHYRPELKPGMEFDRALEILENLYLGKADYDPSTEPESPTEKATAKLIDDESVAVNELRSKWESMGIKVNLDGPREPFFDRRQNIDPEFFKLGLEYYEIVAGYGEFDSTYDGYVKKWDSPIKVFLDFQNKPNEAVVKAMDRVVMQLNSLELLPKISWTDNPEEYCNIHILFANYDELTYLMPTAPPGNWGFFFYNWGDDPLFEIISADVGVADDINREYHMIHLLQEEFIQSLGLINDGELYVDSIFHQMWGHVQYPSELDWLLIEMHYRPEITPGMPMKEALKILENLYLGN